MAIDPRMERPAASFVLTGLLMLGAAQASAEARPGQCGYDRWPVKILADKDRGEVDQKAVDTTVAKLVAIPIHEVRYPYDRRLKPEEVTVYRVSAKLVAIKHEQDSDVHVIIQGLHQPKLQMIVEIPAPECAEGTGHEDDYRKARAALSKIPIGSTIEVTGVGFFDFLHSSTGQARNGIELHPVLKIAVTAQSN